MNCRATIRSRPLSIFVLLIVILILPSCAVRPGGDGGGWAGGTPSTGSSATGDAAAPGPMAPDAAGQPGTPGQPGMPGPAGGPGMRDDPGAMPGAPGPAGGPGPAGVPGPAGPPGGLAQPGQPGGPGPGGTGPGPGGRPDEPRPVNPVDQPNLNVFGGAESLELAVIALHKECTDRAAGKDNEGNSVPPADAAECMREVRRFFMESDYVFRDGQSCTSEWDSDLQKIVVSGPEAECRPLFPQNSEERRGLVEQTSYEYRRNTSMNGATDMASAAAQVYAFCATEPGIDRERCREEAENLLKTIRVNDSDASDDQTQGCVGLTKYDLDDGVYYLSVSASGDSDCTTEFPKAGTPERDAAVEAGAESSPLTGTDGAQTLVAALFQGCDEQSAATPDQIAQCQQAATDQLASEQLEFVTTTDGPCRATRDSATSRIVVTGPATCRELLPDAVTARAEAVNQAALAYQRIEALRGTADLRAATTALYAVCDRVPDTERAACRTESESLLKKVTVVRTGTGCAAELGPDRNTPTIVVGPNCAEGFPEGATNREKIVKQAATEYVPPTGPAAETGAVRSLPRVNAVPDGPPPAVPGQPGPPAEPKPDPAVDGAEKKKEEPVVEDANKTKTTKKKEPAAAATTTTKKKPPTEATTTTKKKPATATTTTTKKKPAAADTENEPAQKQEAG